jgi:hypothetical protein
MGGLELGKVVAGALRVPPLQAMLVVVAPDREPSDLPHEPNNPERIRPLGHQISHQNQLIVLFPAGLLEQVLELFEAAVDISHDEGTGGHISILGASRTESKFVRPPIR